jgi:hypothetical protein
MFGMKRTNFLKDDDMRVVSIAGTAAEAEPLCCEWAEVCQKRKIQKRQNNLINKSLSKKKILQKK